MDAKTRQIHDLRTRLAEDRGSMAPKAIKSVERYIEKLDAMTDRQYKAHRARIGWPL